MEPTARTYVQAVVAAALGAGYGLWGLEAASPLAIPLLLWAVLVLLLAWRMPPTFGRFIGYVAAFVVGFGAVWTIVLGHLIATCRPPSCQTADAATDVFYAAALLVPLVIAASALLAVRKLVLHQ
jgi:hypothetical protein